MKFLPGVLGKAILAVALFCFARAEGRIYIVTNTNDSTEAGSLRGAIIAANKDAANRKTRFNTILLQPKTYHLSIAGAGEDAALTGDLDITQGDMTIMAVNGTATIDATGLGDRVFHVRRGVRLSLKNLNITGGTSSPGVNAGDWEGKGGDGENGGGIYNSGTLTLSHCIISNNLCGAGGQGPFFDGDGGNGGSGAALYNAGTLTMDDCIVDSNVCGSGSDSGFAYGNGGNGGNGGIYNAGYLRLNRCVFKNNSCGVGGAGSINGGPTGIGGGGGGLYNAGTVIVDNCTISNNFCGNGGGGYRYNNGGNGGDGGGFYNTGDLRACFENGFMLHWPGV